MAKKIKKWVDWKTEAGNIEVAGEVEKVDRSEINIQNFMNDMQLIGNQVRDPKLKKPTFFYGDLSVTNYLLWLMLAELTILNKANEVE